MNTVCIICTDLISPAGQIYATTSCSHIFHHNCLTQWFQQSKTCPECRKNLSSNGMFRLYLTVPSAAADEESSLLQTCLDAAQTLLTHQKTLCKKKEEKLNALNATMKKNEDLVKTYQEKVESLEQSIEEINSAHSEVEVLLRRKIQHLEGDLLKTYQEKVQKLEQDIEKMVREHSETEMEVKKKNAAFRRDLYCRELCSTKDKLGKRELAANTQSEKMKKLITQNEALKNSVQTLNEEILTYKRKVYKMKAMISAYGLDTEENNSISTGNGVEESPLVLDREEFEILSTPPVKLLLPLLRMRPVEKRLDDIGNTDLQES